MNRRIWIACLACLGSLITSSTTVSAQGRERSLTANRVADDPVPLPRRPLTEDEMVRQRQQELLQEFDGEPSLDHGDTINPLLMRTVKDNVGGVRFEERAAYLRILRLAQEVPLRRQEKNALALRSERRELNPDYRRRTSKEFPQFVDLFTHPEFYRGRSVTIHGVLRKLTKFDLGKNSLDLDQAYEGWIYTDDCQGLPAVVVFTSKDERLPVNGDLQEEVTVTGYFFKMYDYDAQDVARKAPLIIAGEVEWIPHPYKSVYRPISLLWYGVVGLAFLIGCYVVWQTNRHEMPPIPPMQVEPDFTHVPPRLHPVPDPVLPHSMIEPQDS